MTDEAQLILRWLARSPHLRQLRQAQAHIHFSFDTDQEPWRLAWRQRSGLSLTPVPAATPCDLEVFCRVDPEGAIRRLAVEPADSPLARLLVRCLCPPGKLRCPELWKSRAPNLAVLVHLVFVTLWCILATRLSGPPQQVCALQAGLGLVSLVALAARLQAAPRLASILAVAICLAPLRCAWPLSLAGILVAPGLAATWAGRDRFVRPLGLGASFAIWSQIGLSLLVGHRRRVQAGAGVMLAGFVLGPALIVAGAVLLCSGLRLPDYEPWSL